MRRLWSRWRSRWVALGRRLAERLQYLDVTWRRSLQLRVGVSTLALCSVVVAALGLVLQTQIADRLVQGKEQAALAQAESSRFVLERDLARVDPDREGVAGTLNNAVAKLTSSGADGDAASTAAGVFQAVLVADGAGAIRAPSVGPVADVPADLRATVAKGFLAREYTTVLDGASQVSTLVVGQPVPTAGRDLEFYLLFPLTAEERTLGLVQSTLVVGGLVLVVLLVAIASLVTRQVVRPVRLAAEVAERFADGHLDERMTVQGDDEVARLAESYNEMATSIQNQIRQLEEFGALQRRFTSDVSHELRTPLTTVRMAAEMLYGAREDLDPALGRSTELLVDELDRFEALLGDLLEISRLDAGVAELGLEQVDMPALLRRAVDGVRPLAEASRTPIVLDVPAEAPAEVDPRRVERILRNVLSNAIDHGEGKRVEVRLGADERSLAVVVRDHGVGLRPGEAGLVFNRFWRADSSRARRSGGTGLGLSISLEDARLHGGWLQAWGEPGRGAAFRLTLPRRPGEELVGSPLPLVPVDVTEPVSIRGLTPGHGPPAPAGTAPDPEPPVSELPVSESPVSESPVSEPLAPVPATSVREPR